MTMKTISVKQDRSKGKVNCQIGLHKLLNIG